MIAAAGTPDAPLSLPYGGRFRDGAVALAAAAGLTATVSLTWKGIVDEDFRLWWVLAGWAVAWLLVLVPLAWFRWGRWVRVDETGVTLMRPRGRVYAELRWEDVEAFAQAGYGGVELQGAGRTLRIGDDIRRVAELWPRVRRHCEERILDGLRERLERGEESVLRMPASRLRAHGSYLGITALLVAQAGLYGWLWYSSRQPVAWATLIHIAVWSWLLLVWRRDVAWLGGWIRVRPQGLELKKLDAMWRVGWDEIVRLVVKSSSGWRLERKLGRAIHIHAGVLNLWPLGRLVGERTGNPLT